MTPSFSTMEAAVITWYGVSPSLADPARRSTRSARRSNRSTMARSRVVSVSPGTTTYTPVPSSPSRLVDPTGCHGDRTVPPTATAAKSARVWPGSCPTRVATSATVKPGGTSRGKTLGPAAMTWSTVAKLLCWRKA